MGRKKQWPPRPHAHKASGQDRVRVNGQEIYLGPTGSQEAKQAYADLLVRLASQEPPAPAPATPRKPKSAELTLGELVQLWDTYAVSRYQPAGREVQQYRTVYPVLLHAHAALPVSKLTVNVLDAIRDRMLALGWCRNVVNRRVIRVRTMIRWSEQKAHVPAGTWAALSALSPLPPNDARVRDTEPRRPCTWPELARVCRQCPMTVRDMLLTCWFTGARPGEVRQMRAGDIERGKPGDVWTFRPGQHKNLWRGHHRSIAIGPKAQKVLGRHLEGKKPKEYVFESSPGKCYRDDSFPRAVARACERAGVEGVTPYTGRHSCKQRVTRAMGLDAARAALGHASVETTAGYAQGVDQRTAEDVARRIG